MTDIRKTNEQYQRNVHQFMQTIRTLSSEQFLQPMNGWSARDIVAHLIGWNHNCATVVNAVQAGETPQVFIDSGDDFSRVNAESVIKYDSKDMVELLREMETSFQALAQCLFKVDEEIWSKKIIIPGLGYDPTIEKCTRAVSEDYEKHRLEIEAWRDQEFGA